LKISNPVSQIRRSLSYRLASLFGLGEVPAAQGTVATLVAGIPCFLIAGRFLWQVQLLLFTILAGIGWYVSHKTEMELGRSDPGEIVIDELCGYLFAMIGHPVSFASILSGFLLFRLFDIWKPWPIGLIDRKLPGGAGVMADDILAGIYANILGLIVIQTINYLLGLVGDI
jgi:phosphatidylglycerophosphatase A